MPLIDSIADIVGAETGGAFPLSLVKSKILDVTRDFCKFSLILNKGVAAIVEATSIDSTKNFAATITIVPYTETEPCGIFGLTVNGCKLASVERDAVSPSGASPIYHVGGIFHKFSGQTTCLIHPLQSGGDVRFSAGFMPTTTATQIDDTFWSLYGNGVMFGIKASLFAMSGYKTTDPNAATMFGREYYAAKRKARGDVNNLIIGECLCS